MRLDGIFHIEDRLGRAITTSVPLILRKHGDHYLSDRVCDLTFLRTGYACKAVATFPDIGAFRFDVSDHKCNGLTLNTTGVVAGETLHIYTMQMAITDSPPSPAQ